MARLLVAAVVLAEIASLILVGRGIGVLATLLLVVLAAVLGAAILRRQGGDALRAMQGALQRGRDPRSSLLRGGFRLVAALLLIVPGFLSDAVALLLLLPPVQRALGRALARRGVRIVETRRGGFGPEPLRPGPPRVRMAEEAEWEEVEEVAPPKPPTHRPSGWTRH